MAMEAKPPDAKWGACISIRRAGGRDLPAIVALDGTSSAAATPPAAVASRLDSRLYSRPKAKGG